MVGVRVGDFTISGDLNESYKAAKQELQSKFKFKRWTHIEERGKLDFCGCSFQKTDYGYHLGHPEYFAKIKPITIDPKTKSSQLATQKETGALRAVLGARQWPSMQTYPALGATVSLLSGDITSATAENFAMQTRHVDSPSKTVMPDYSSDRLVKPPIRYWSQ